MPLPAEQWGLVAILDALGAANYTNDEIGRFFRSRETILALLNEKAEAILGEIKTDRLSMFTFNDTILVLYRTDRQATARDVKAFFTLLRKFMIDSLTHRVLFRGSIAIGAFYVDEDANSVMGAAVTDAAAWYDRADWIGIHATPHASMAIEAMGDYDATSLQHLIVDHEVPMNDTQPVRLKVVNWPKAFFVANLTPCADGEEPRTKFLSLLSKHPVPKGTERKYFNTIIFFDRIAESLAKVKPKKRAPHG